MGSEETPFEVGLGFAVNFDKAQEFIGKAALLKQQKDGWTKALLLCEVLAKRVLILHDEPVYLDEKIVGHCTSGGIGFRTDKTLCFIMIKKDVEAPPTSLSSQPYKIEVAGKKFNLRMLKKPPYQEYNK